MTKQEILIDPITRLEGHGNISIFLDDKGEVENAYLKVPELRGFEQFCVGRRGELMPQLTPRICGVCPVAHHFAATKALDACYNAEPTPTAKKLRELLYSGYYIYDHTLHFYFLGGPDFVVGPDAPAAERNIIGVIGKVGLDVAKEVIKHRAYGQKIVQIIGGKATHPVCGLPGGISKALSEANRQEILAMAESSVKFAEFTLKVFHDIVLANPGYVDLIKSDMFTQNTNYMGMVDENNKVNFYDGKIRVVDPSGKEIIKFEGKDYTNVLAEHVEPWTYCKMPYLKKIGWKGLVAGPDSGVYRVAPLARLNVSNGMATPKAQAAYEEMKSVLGKPVHGTLAFHWARVIELLYAAERTVELAKDPEITGTNIRAKLGDPGEGVGVIEAARGTLYHHYKLDKNGLIEKANLVVATISNYPSMCMSIRDAAKGLIHNGKFDQGTLNKVEMAFRAYDPCFGCATHYAVGQMPMEVTVYNHNKQVVNHFKR